MTENPIVHGLLYSYIGKGCRCEDCKGAMRQYSHNYRSTPEGYQRTLRSSRRTNYLRRRAVAWMKENRPDVFHTFEVEWADSDGQSQA